jgi:hypothetical protein
MYVKLYFSDITKDPENQPPPQNQTDVIIYGYKHLLPFATTGRQHHCPLLEAPLPSLSSSATAFFAATAHGCHCHHHPPPWMLPSLPPSATAIFRSASPSSSLSAAAAASLSSAAAAIIVILHCSCHVFVLLHHSNHIFVLRRHRRHHRPLLEVLLPSSSSFAANNTLVKLVKMKSLEDVVINGNDDTGKKTKEENYCRRDKKVIKKKLPNPPPRNTLRARMQPQTSQELQMRMTSPRILP